MVWPTSHGSPGAMVFSSVYLEEFAKVNGVYYLFAKVNGVEEYYIFLDSDDSLEQNFAIIRELHGSGTQFDLVQFEDRETTAMSIQDIYSRHPEWHQGPRRLSASLDHMNPSSWLR